MIPLCIDLFCGLFGWGKSFVEEGYDVVGFDLMDMSPKLGRLRPKGCQLIIQDVLTLHGSQFRDATCIVASPPCTEYSYMGFPFGRGKQIERALRGEDEFPKGYIGSRTIEQLNALFNACFRIQREACEAAGRYIPMVVENVCGAQKWVGPAKWHYGSFYFWGDVPALMPSTNRRMKYQSSAAERMWKDREVSRLNDGQKWVTGGSWFAVEPDGRTHPQRGPHGNDGVKSGGYSWSDYGKEGYKAVGFNVTNAQRLREENGGGQESRGSGQLVRDESGRSARRENGTKSPDPTRGVRGWFGREGGTGVTVTDDLWKVAADSGTKQGGTWWHDPQSMSRRFSSRSDSRKAASAQIAKIPASLARHIARCFKP